MVTLSAPFECATRVADRLSLAGGAATMRRLRNGVQALAPSIQMDPDPELPDSPRDLWLLQKDRQALLSWAQTPSGARPNDDSVTPAELADLANDLLADEWSMAAFRALMSLGLGGLSADWALSGPTSDLGQVLPFATQFLELRGPAGAFVRGQMPIFSDGLATQLERESRRSRSMAIRTGPQLVGPPGTLAKALHTNTTVCTWVESHSGKSVRPGKIGGYLFYEEAGDCLYPHIDRLQYDINLITTISLTGGRTSRSGTMVVVGERVDKFQTVVGDSLAFYASRTIHGRDALPPGESICILSLGYQVR